MMFFDDNLLDDNFLMDTLVERAFTASSPLTLSLVDQISEHANEAAANTQENDCSAATASLLSRVHRILIVAIRAVIEVIAIPIVVDQHECGRIVPGGVVIISWPVINIELMVSPSTRIVLVVVVH